MLDDDKLQSSNHGECNKPTALLRNLNTHRIGGPFQDLNDKIAIGIIESDAGGVGSRYQIGQVPETQRESDMLAYSPMTLFFQDQPEKVGGVRGATNEALIAIVIDRLEGFQDGQYPCQENSEAIIHLWQALRCLHNRTVNRVARGVEGTHSK